jgi:hypothetical protein
MKIAEIKYIKIIWDWFKSLPRLTQQIIISSIMVAWVCTFFIRVDEVPLIAWYCIFAMGGFVVGIAGWIIWNIAADLTEKLNKE